MKNCYLLLLKNNKKETILIVKLSGDLKKIKIIKGKDKYKKMIRELISCGTFKYIKNGINKLEIGNEIFIQDIYIKTKIYFKNVFGLKNYLKEKNFIVELKKIDDF